MKSHFNLPFLECVFNLAFMPTPEFDMTIPGLYLSKIQDEYTKKKDLHERKMRLPGINGDNPEIVSTPVIQFLSNNGKFVSQIGKDVFAFNQISDFKNWEKFKGELLKLLSYYRSLINQDQIRALALRFLFRIDSDLELEPNEYFNFAFPSNPIKEEAGVKAINALAEYDAEDDDFLSISLKTIDPGENINFQLLEIGFNNNNPGSVKIDNIDDWLEKSIGCINNGIRSCVTDKLIKKYHDDEMV